MYEKDNHIVKLEDVPEFLKGDLKDGARELYQGCCFHLQGKIVNKQPLITEQESLPEFPPGTAPEDVYFDMIQGVLVSTFAAIPRSYTAQEAITTISDILGEAIMHYGFFTPTEETEERFMAICKQFGMVEEPTPDSLNTESPEFETVMNRLAEAAKRVLH